MADRLGADAKVMEPQSLFAEVRKECDKILQMNSFMNDTSILDAFLACIGLWP